MKTTVQQRTQVQSKSGKILHLQRKCANYNLTAGESFERCTKHEPGLPRNAAARHQPRETPSLVQNVLRSPGRPIDSATREFFELRFGHDFSNVRVHTDAKAAESARRLNALAYTSGRNIVFAHEQYNVGSMNSYRLLAHELTHIVQQRNGLWARDIASVHDAADQEAGYNAENLFTKRPLRFNQQPGEISFNRVGETTVSVEAPTRPPGCGLAQHRVIAPAVRHAQQWLSTAVRRLTEYIRAPADQANRPVRQALNRHFRNTNPVIAGRIRERLKTIRTDMVTRDPFAVECHDTTDPSCTNTSAYIPRRNQNLYVFCPLFFSSSSIQWRAGSLIHEMAHALLGLRIADRAYRNDRLLPYLSTAEALDNAESYALVTEELATNRAVVGNPPQDVIEDCAGRVQPLVREALGRAQRWNRDAQVISNDTRPVVVRYYAPQYTTNLGNNLPATRAAAARVFTRMYTRLRSPIDVRCDSRAAPECASRSAYRKPGRSNIGLGAGIGAAIGAGVGLIAGLATGFLFGLIGIAVGIGALALGTLIGLIAGAATSRRDAVHLCPAWRTQSPDDRAESLLAAIYETYAGLNVTQSRNHARLARQIHTRFIGAPPPL